MSAHRLTFDRNIIRPALRCIHQFRAKPTEIRDALRCVRIEAVKPAKDRKVRLVATDAYTLAVLDVPLAAPLPRGFTVAHVDLPRPSEINAVLGLDGGAVHLDIGSDTDDDGIGIPAIGSDGSWNDQGAMLHRAEPTGTLALGTTHALTLDGGAVKGEMGRRYPNYRKIVAPYMDGTSSVGVGLGEVALHPALFARVCTAVAELCPKSNINYFRFRTGATALDPIGLHLTNHDGIAVTAIVMPIRVS